MPDRLAGKQLVCPKCSTRQLVPAVKPRSPGQQTHPPAVSRLPVPTGVGTGLTLQAVRRHISSSMVVAVCVVVLLVALTIGVAVSIANQRGKRAASDTADRPADAKGSADKITEEMAAEEAGGPSAAPSHHSTTSVESATGVPEPDGMLIELPPIRPMKELREGLRLLDDKIASLPVDSPAGESMAALIRLRMYRFLCGLPEADITLDDRLNVEALAAAEVCRRLGKLTHEPENPGMPADDYERARRGAGSGNLASGMNSLSRAVDCWMDDSDATNIAVLGHRRWCLNPPLQRVGFGRIDRWCAMWAHDTSGTESLERQAICFPPPGDVPIDLFRPHYAWSITLNPRFFQKPRNVVVTVRARHTDGSFGEPLPLECCDVDTKGCGIDNCIVFRSRDISTAVGKRYVVNVTGARNHDNQPQAISYEVMFVEP